LYNKLIFDNDPSDDNLAIDQIYDNLNPG